MAEFFIRKLNAFCRESLLPRCYNADTCPEPNLDQFIDHEMLSLPLTDITLNESRADHNLKLRRNPLAMTSNPPRACALETLFCKKVPQFSRSFFQADHKCGFDVTLPYYSSPSFPSGYAGRQLTSKYQRMSWFGQPYLKRTIMPAPMYCTAYIAGGVIAFFLNLSLLICSRLWCWVSGFEGYEMSFKAVKS